MSSLQIFPYGAQPLDPGKNSKNIGIISSQGGLVILDEPFARPSEVAPYNIEESQYSHHIHVGVGGNLLCEMADGTINPFLGLLGGATVLVKAVRVVSSATLNDGVVWNTTADQITWHGGQ